MTRKQKTATTKTRAVLTKKKNGVYQLRASSMSLHPDKHALLIDVLLAAEKAQVPIPSVFRSLAVRGIEAIAAAQPETDPVKAVTTLFPTLGRRIYRRRTADK